MSTEILICRCQTRIAFLTYAILTASPLFFFGAALYGAYLHGWRMFFAVFPAAIFMAIFAWIYGTERARLRRSSLEIDAHNGRLVFRHFRFIASFLPEKPREVETVQFDQVLAIRRVEVQKGIWGLRVKTVKGDVTISEEMEHFDVIETTLAGLVESNRSQATEYRGNVEAAPKIKTAWYGWLILFGAVGAIIFVGWKLMYSD